MSNMCCSVSLEVSRNRLLRLGRHCPNGLNLKNLTNFMFIYLETAINYFRRLRTVNVVVTQCATC